MKHTIEDIKDGLKIKISEVASNHEELMSNFQSCKDGKCDCPSGEYVKLEDLKIQKTENELILELTAKDSLKFDKSEVEKCVEFIIDKVSNK